MKVPLDPNIDTLPETPYTISYTIRKRIQIDNLSELPKDKRPPEWMIWDATSSELDNWITNVLKGKTETKANLVIDESKIEG